MNLQHVKASSSDTLLNGLKIEAKLHYGFVYPHHDAIQYVLNGRINGAEITLSTSSSGRHVWEQMYRFPNYGLGYNYTNFSNPQILGCSYALFAFYEVPVIKVRDKFSFNYKIDFGLAYINRKFDVSDNPLNLAISSNFNAYVGVDFTLKYKLFQKNEIKTSLELNHFSNGKFKSPNLGLNAAMLSVAWLYSIRNANPLSPRPLTNKYRRHFTEFVFNSGLKRDDMLNEKLYYISNFIAEYNYSFSWKYSIGGGADFFMDNTLGPTKVFEEGIPEKSGDNFQMGAHLSFQARFNRMAVFFNAGHYIVANYYKYSPIFGRVGMRYAITENILVNLSVKTHYAIADYVEWGIGYRINSKGL